MIEIVKQIIQFYLKNKKIPTKNDIEISNFDVFEKKGTLFVTLYKNGEIFGSSGNIVEIEQDILSELIQNTVQALNDPRFGHVENVQIDSIKIRVDVIAARTQLIDKKISEINPVKQGVLVIKKDYTKLGVVLPNISNKISSGNDLYAVLGAKLNENFQEENYLTYSLDTEITTNY